MDILIVDDEPKLASLLRGVLQERDFRVDVASDGVQGRALAKRGCYDLAVLDVGLPGVDGFTVLRTLRDHPRTRVLMITGRGGIEDRVRGLQEGADDYLVKPFAIQEFLARVDALLRRGQNVMPNASVLHVADLEVDVLRRRTSRAGRHLHLTAKEFSLLTLLIRNRGKVLSRKTLAEQLWDMNFAGDFNVVDVAIWRLRAKMDDPFERKLLQAVRGVGYVIDEVDRA
jgi:two-component system, OmpR family, copper resistance phosphate regulon response regulator CusR